MAFEELTLVTIPGHETWKGFSMAVDVESAAHALWEAQQLQRALKAGAWDNLPMAQQYENTRRIFMWIGRMFSFMNTPPWNSTLWQDHFSKWHGTLRWNNPYTGGNSVWSGLQPTDPAYIATLTAGPQVVFASGGLSIPVSCRPLGMSPGADVSDPASCNTAYIRPSIFGQRIRQAALAIKNDGNAFGNGTHIVMFTLGPNGNLISAPSGASPVSAEPQYNFTGLYNGAGCCYYAYKPDDDRLLRAAPGTFTPGRDTPLITTLPNWIDTAPPVTQVFDPPTVNQYVAPNVQTDIPLRPLNQQFVAPQVETIMPMGGPRTLLNSPPMQLTPVPPSGGVMGAPWSPSGGCCGGASGRVRPSGAVDGRGPDYDPAYPLSPDGHSAPGTGQTPYYGWTRSACGEIPSDATDMGSSSVKYSAYCFRWNDTPLNIKRVLPALRWAMDEAVDLVDTMSLVPIWDHIVRARVRQMLEMVARADALGVPDATDPLDAPAVVMEGQLEAMKTWQKSQHIDPKDPGLVTTDVVVGTAAGVLAAIPGMQVAAAIVAGAYALGRFLATVFPQPFTFATDVWGRPEPSLWPGTIFDIASPPEKQMPAVNDWSPAGPSAATLKTLGGAPDKPVIPSPPSTLPDLKQWMDDYKTANGLSDGQSSGVSTVLVVAGVAAAAGFAWWLATRNGGAGTPRKNPSRRGTPSRRSR